MAEPRKTSDWLIVAALVAALLLGPLVLYVGAYLLTAEAVMVEPYMAVGEEKVTYRVYDSQWERRLYYPAAKVESALTGQQVRLIGNFDLGFEDFDF